MGLIALNFMLDLIYLLNAHALCSLLAYDLKNDIGLIIEMSSWFAWVVNTLATQWV